VLRETEKSQVDQAGRKKSIKLVEESRSNWSKKVDQAGQIARVENNF
jgi:hypothetical protein